MKSVAIGSSLPPLHGGSRTVVIGFLLLVWCFLGYDLLPRWSFYHVGKDTLAREERLMGQFGKCILTWDYYILLSKIWEKKNFFYRHSIDQTS